MEPLFAMDAAGLRWLNILAGLVVVTVVGIVVAAASGSAGLAASLIVILVIEAMIWMIMPRRFDVYADRLVMASPLKQWQVGFGGIEKVAAARWWQAYGYRGVRLATSPAQALTVERKRPSLLLRPNLVISPGDLTPDNEAAFYLSGRVRVITDIGEREALQRAYVSERAMLDAAHLEDQTAIGVSA